MCFARWALMAVVAGDDHCIPDARRLRNGRSVWHRDWFTCRDAFRAQVFNDPLEAGDSFRHRLLHQLVTSHHVATTSRNP